MAMTVGTVTVSSPKSFQANFLARTTLDFDDDYPGTEGGYPLGTLLDVKGKLLNYSVLHVLVEPAYDTPNTTGYFFVWDSANALLKVLLQATGAEAADAADLSNLTGVECVILCE